MGVVFFFLSVFVAFFFFQAEDGIRDLVRSRGLGDVYKRQVCESEKGMTHLVREMMFGMRQAFHYFECDHCCCLSLLNPPDDMSLFYPPDKYLSLIHI